MTKFVVSYDPLAEEMCRALGEDPEQVRSINIEVEAGDVMRAIIVKFVSRDPLLFEIIKKVAWKEVSREEYDPLKTVMVDETPMKLTKEMIDDVPQEIIDKTKRMIEDGCREILDGKE